MRVFKLALGYIASVIIINKAACEANADQNGWCKPLPLSSKPSVATTREIIAFVHIIKTELFCTHGAVALSIGCD